MVLDARRFRIDWWGISEVQRMQRYAIESLERRQLLSSLVINGNSGPDILNLEADVGRIFLNGSTYNMPGVTDVQVFGGDGDDLLVIYHASIPVYFDGGNGADEISLTSGLMSGQITTDITFSGGPGHNTAEARDEIWPGATRYSLTRVPPFERLAWSSGGNAGSLSLDAASLTVNTAAGGCDFDDAMFGSTMSVVVNGGSGADHFKYGMDRPMPEVKFNGGGGADSLEIDDLWQFPDSEPTYAISSTFVQQGAFGPIVQFNPNDIESIVFKGRQTVGKTYNVFSSGPFALSVIGGAASDQIWFWPEANGNLHGPVSVNAGGGDDEFVWKAADNVVDNGFRPVKYPVLLDGGTGANSLEMRDDGRGATAYDLYPDRIRGQDPVFYNGADFNFANIQILTINASDSANSFDVHGIPPGNPQVVVNANGGDDALTLLSDPRSPAALTFNAGAGANSVSIDDSAYPTSSSYVLTNGALARTCGASLSTVTFSPISAMTLIGGSGDDTFNVNPFTAGASLAVLGGNGNDTVKLGTGSLVAVDGITLLSFDGQAGTDVFSVNNGTGGSFTWSWTKNQNTLRAMMTSEFVDYDRTFTYNNVERISVSSNAAGDTFTVNAVAPGTEFVANAGGGLDRLTITSADAIAGPITYLAGSGGGNLVVTDTADTTGDTLHLTAATLGAYANDTFFAPGGSLQFSGLTDNVSSPAITLDLGSGADTIYAQPLVGGRVIINASNPTAAPGDKLNLALAAALSYQINPSGTSGNVTSSNLQTLSWTGVEQSVSIDAAAPAVSSAGYSFNSNQIDIQFSKNIGLLNVASVQLTNLTTSQALAATTVALSSGNTHAAFSLPTNLPDGNYHGVLVASLAADAFGNSIPTDVPFDFFALAGDANRDRIVNVSDLGVFATNWQGIGKTFAQGDFNYDGTVNVADLGILATSWQKSLAAPALAVARESSPQPPRPQPQPPPSPRDPADGNLAAELIG